MATEGSGRRRSLVIELGSATVVLDGRRLELPAKKFRLLAELAARPGDPIPAETLLQRVWPDVHGMAPQDLYWHIWQLRRALGDTNREDKLVAHRRGYGYLIDLPKDAVKVVDVEHKSSQASVPHDPDLEPDIEKQNPPPPIRQEDSSEIISSTPRIRLPSLASVALAIGLCAAAWFAGFGVARLTAPPIPTNEIPAPTKDNKVSKRGQNPSRSAPRRPGKRPASNRRRVDSRQGGTPPVAAPAVPNQQPVILSDASAPTREKAPERRERAKTEAVAAPAPNGYLYHLFDRKTDDHFVTTDADKVDEYRGRGYSGTAVARVYTYAERRAPIRGISLNFGQAYVFTTSSPETSPKIATVKLFYAANGQGDFFYTTQPSDASEGWDITFVGYVGAP